MIFEWRIVAVALAAFAAAGMAASALVPVLLRRPGADDAARRARQIARIRLLPTVAAAITMGIVLAAFLTFESRRDDEPMGWAVQGLAILGALVLATGVWRGVRVFAATRRLTRIWLSHATPAEVPGVSVPVLAVTSAFPIVAVVGLRQPRLIVARSVLEGCSPDELRAIAAHEHGHITRRDNLKRVMLAVAPDVLSWLPVSRRVFEEWRNAAEQAADDDAAGQDEQSRLNLASALLKVARLASGTPGRVVVPASAFYCGEDLERRIRRLLDAHAVAPVSAPPVAALVAAAGAGLALAAQTLEPLHALVERTIHALP